jgi:hypothetical protein
MKSNVIAASCDSFHRFSKSNRTMVRLIAGFGVEGDAHAGSTVRHLDLANKDPDLPNLRQVHLIQAELFEELKGCGFEVRAGDLGENVTTLGINLLALPLGTLLHLGSSAVVEVTGLRIPCSRIDRFQKGLKRTMIVLGPGRSVSFKAGIMGIVRATGEIKCGDEIHSELPAQPWMPLPFL